ncbi:uncharacterized protein CEXT_15741 [Caerostris extrusa]|uniref:Complex 1 LYR protein domain-containing protein n=1 Tax=Caerostris extrusa TaxID=172846 RepID=A0AAV4RD64_CAEEX|nr:uncharacterized protein CEXT_15741 [Caerostris extrusa]
MSSSLIQLIDLYNWKMTRSNAIKLYRDLFKYSKTLKYTDKNYFLSEVKKQFNKNKSLTNSEEINYQFKRAENFLKNKRLL